MIAANKRGGHKKKGHKRKKHHATTPAAAASAVKHAVDQAASEMKRMAEKCKADIKKAKAQATRKAHGGKKKKHRKKKAGGKKKHHAKKHHPKKTGGGYFGRTVEHKAPKKRRSKKRAKVFGAFGRSVPVKSVSAKSIIAGATRKKGKGMQRWVCEAPVRTGCGGGASGGHVLGDLSPVRARRLR